MRKEGWIVFGTFCGLSSAVLFLHLMRPLEDGPPTQLPMPPTLVRGTPEFPDAGDSSLPRDLREYLSHEWSHSGLEGNAKDFIPNPPPPIDDIDWAMRNRRVLEHFRQFLLADADPGSQEWHRGALTLDQELMQLFMTLEAEGDILGAFEVSQTWLLWSDRILGIEASESELLPQVEDGLAMRQWGARSLGMLLETDEPVSGETWRAIGERLGRIRLSERATGAIVACSPSWRKAALEWPLGESTPGFLVERTKRRIAERIRKQRKALRERRWAEVAREPLVPSHFEGLLAWYHGNALGEQWADEQFRMFPLPDSASTIPQDEYTPIGGTILDPAAREAMMIEAELFGLEAVARLRGARDDAERREIFRSLPPNPFTGHPVHLDEETRTLWFGSSLSAEAEVLGRPAPPSDPYNELWERIWRFPL